MEISVPVPLDSDGFMRRECPACEQEFKWHYGPANEEAEQASAVNSYFCPLCGRPAVADQWLTRAQVDLIQGTAMPAFMRRAQEMISDELRGSKFFTFKPSTGSDVPDAPLPLTEPDDMKIVTSPCHGYEPVKVPENAAPPFHCLICGAAYAV
jgi:hypothetical protein